MIYQKVDISLLPCFYQY